MPAKYALTTVRKMKITASLFDAGLKCVTKCFLRSPGEAGTGNAYSEWVRTKSDFYHGEGIKRLMARAAHNECIRGLPGTVNLKTAEWRFTEDFVAHSKNLESSIHALERIPAEGQVSPRSLFPFDLSSLTNLPELTSCYWHSMRLSYRRCWVERSVWAGSSTGTPMPR
jgi:hypothetical protein